VAFVVVDRYQEQGVGTALMRHVAAIARNVGPKELTAEVLADNFSMLKVLEKSGFACKNYARCLRQTRRSPVFLKRARVINNRFTENEEC
jgi:GNAT superfamily N-acetyltransferase